MVFCGRGFSPDASHSGRVATLKKSVGAEAPPTTARVRRAGGVVARSRLLVYPAHGRENAAVFLTQGFVPCKATPSPCTARSAPTSWPACARTPSSAGRRVCRSSRSSIR
ncbi:DUF6053 domain-containing protein [Lysobacter yananisis]|uniref:DUF6053 domain-containing protein n=1 Tax=Lysobacter yananisis TaxID=1003114 RepID=UPI003CE4C978